MLGLKRTKSVVQVAVRPGERNWNSSHIFISVWSSYVSQHVAGGKFRRRQVGGKEVTILLRPLYWEAAQLNVNVIYLTFKMRSRLRLLLRLASHLITSGDVCHAWTAAAHCITTDAAHILPTRAPFIKTCLDSYLNLVLRWYHHCADVDK